MTHLSTRNVFYEAEETLVYHKTMTRSKQNLKGGVALGMYGVVTVSSPGTGSVGTCRGISMLRKTLDRVRKRRQGIGTSRLVLYGFVWLLRKLSAGAVDIHYCYVHLQEVRTEPLLRNRARGRSSVRTLQGTELLLEFDRDQVGVFNRPPSDFPRFKRRVERGDICIAVTRPSKTVGVLWLTFEAFDETGVKAVFVVSPSDRMAWASNIFIVDDARGGLHVR